jgi:hypothetical protein
MCTISFIVINKKIVQTTYFLLSLPLTSLHNLIKFLLCFLNEKKEARNVVVKNASLIN